MAADVGLFLSFDAGADGLRLPFYRFRRDFDTSQQLQLLAALIKTGFAAHRRHHAAYAGRVGNAFHVQFPVARAVAVVATGTNVIASLEPHRAQSG